MAQMTLSQVLELAEQLNPKEQAILIERLQLRQRVTRESLLAEFERRKAQAASDTLFFGKYGSPSVEVSTEELETTGKVAW